MHRRGLVFGGLGPVGVVFCHIQGLTHRLPLPIKVSYNANNTVGAFGAATRLMVLSLITLGFKTLFEWDFSYQPSSSHRH
jgi:sulfate transport system permease protein